MIFRPKHLHTKLEPSKVVYTGIPEAFTVKKFIDATVHGLVGHMTQDNSDQFKKPLCVVYYGVDYKLNPKGKFLRGSDTVVYTLTVSWGSRQT